MDIDWELLRVFEVVARSPTLTAAARALGINQSTVSRKVEALEGQAPTPLLIRENPLRLTERGRALAEAVRGMAQFGAKVETALAASREVAGEVTLATVSELLRWVLVRELPSLRQSYPQLRLRILADPRTVSLATGEADLAVRMNRPQQGAYFARKLRTYRSALWASTDLSLGSKTPWLGLCGHLERLPEHQCLLRMFAGRAPACLFEDAEALGHAVASGLGVSVLLEPTSERLQPRIRTVQASDVGGKACTLPHRSVWLVMHRSRRQLPAVRAVATWVSKALGSGNFPHEG